MKNPQHWRPSKFVYHKGILRASRDPGQVAVSSRFIADRIAQVYEGLIKKYARGDLLDLGCGQAPLYIVYKDLTTSQTCVDWNAMTNDIDIVDYKMDLNKGLCFKDDTFDTVLLTDTLEHIYNPEELFDEMERILRPSGVIIVGVPFFYWIHEAPHDFFRYTEFKLRQFCTSRKLKVVFLEAYGGVPEILVDIVAKILSGKRLSANIFRYFSGWISQTKYFVSLSRKTRANFPMGYTLVAKKR